MVTRPVTGSLSATPTVDGAGVRLNRVFGFGEKGLFDPFLLLDDFRSDDPEDYIAGFPWHPHRGMETVTYLLRGRIRHRDSLGNVGVLGPGDIQWMTAGSGIIHEEMPEQADGALWGLQLWVNLPRSHKMMAPRYQDIPSARVPEVALSEGGVVRVLAGRYGDVVGPVEDVVADPCYLDVELPGGGLFEHATATGHTLFAYVLEGAGSFAPGASENRALQLVRFGDGGRVRVVAGDAGVRFLLVSGLPLGEPVAWRGPIVMNTSEELETAFREVRDGTFLKVDR